MRGLNRIAHRVQRLERRLLPQRFVVFSGANEVEREQRVAELEAQGLYTPGRDLLIRTMELGDDDWVSMPAGEKTTSERR